MLNRQLLGSLGIAAELVYRAAPTEELLRRFALDRDADAFSALVERFRAFVVRRCRSVLGDDDLALDAAQETFIALARHAPRLLGPGRLVRWLEKVARNKAKDIRRREQRMRRLVTSILPTAHDLAGKIAEQLQRNEVQEQVNQALAQLPRKHRQVVELCHLDGLTQREVAAILGAPASTIAWRVQEGLERLKRILSRRGLAPTTLAALPGLFAPQAEAAALGATRKLAEVSLALAANAGFPAKLGGPGLSVHRVLAALAGITLALIVAALASWNRTTPPTIPERSAEPIATRELPRETLQQAYLKSLDQDVLPIVVEALRPLTLGNGEITVMNRGVLNHHLTCDIRVRHFSDQPQMAFTTGYRFKYDALGRGFAMWVDLFGTGEEKPIDPKRPALRWNNPWNDPSSGMESVVFAETTRTIEQAFHRLPIDDRAIAERNEGWENQPKPSWLKGPAIPGMVHGSAGNRRQLFVRRGTWLWCADLNVKPLRWRCIGMCEAYFSADDNALYTIHERMLLTRPTDGETLHWQPMGSVAFDTRGLAVVADHIFCVRRDQQLVGRILSQANNTWIELGETPPGRIFGYQDLLYCETDDHRLLMRPVGLSRATWTQLEQSMPTNLAIAGGRLWGFFKESETIYKCRSRPLDGPNTNWWFEGTVIPIESTLPATILRFDYRKP